MPKLVKETKTVKLFKRTGSVISTFRKAERVAIEQGWNKVIITGEGKDAGYTFTSRMPHFTRLGLLEVTKQSLLED